MRDSHGLVDAQVATAWKRIPRKVVPDRIIAATALHFGLPLGSGDRRLPSAGIQTIW